mmetsp:Transcript_83534/g.258312  ORF Transcript_83534/g.258312 Transcript_83534/m.258312 type:complete len:329 (-) Transcript_83534:21-1007(-)
MFLRASSSLQSYLHPVEPRPPDSCIVLTASRYAGGRSCARPGDSTKKVSCASRAGCCWGWKSVSKFQNELSIHWFVGISSKPISRRMLRISVLTFMRGCKQPPVQRAPLALEKLRVLKALSFHVPFRIISAVNSASALLPPRANFSVLHTRKAVVLVGATSFLFFRGSTASLPRLSRARRLACVSSTTESQEAANALVCLSREIQRFFIATPTPTLPASPSAASTASLVTGPSRLTKLKTCTSGLPASQYCWPSAVSFQPSRFIGVVVIRSSASRDLRTPTRDRWSQPRAAARAHESGTSPSFWRTDRRASFISPAIPRRGEGKGRRG